MRIYSLLAKRAPSPLPHLRLQAPVLLVLGGLLCAALVLAASVGAISIPVPSLLDGDLSEQQAAVLYHIRVPRVLLAALVGASLAVSGAAMQGLFRNPLADPGLIGISSGAALAVAIVIVLAGPFAGVLGLYGLSIAAFAGGLMTSLLIFRFAQLTGTFSVTYMLLAGIAINAIAAAGIGLFMFASTDQELRELSFWLLGRERANRRRRR